MFKLICKIAWASLKRRKVRSLLVILMITMSLWGLLLMQGIYEGMTEQMINNAIRSDSGDITLYGKGYRMNSNLDIRIRNEHDIYSLLENSQQVKSYTARILQDCLAATAHYSQNALLLGVDLGQEQRHGQLAGYLIAGEYSFGKNSKGVIIGSRLADKLKVSPGSKLVLSAQDTAGDVASLALKVTGIIKTNNMLLDGQALLVDRQKASTMLQIESGVSQISIILHPGQPIHTLQNIIQDRFNTVEVFRWDQLYPALMQGKVMMEGFNLVTSMLVFAVAGLGIFGVMMVSVLERLREFGIMLAVGTSFQQIRLIVFVESFFLGVLGFLAGSFAGGLTLFYFAEKGLDLSLFSEGLDTFGMDAITYAVVRPSYFLTAWLAVVLATAISVVFPLRFLRKARPIDAIHKL